jgi:hypothetical protein
MEDPITRGLGTRRDEDIALDLMKFIAGSTGYRKTSAPGVGFQGGVSSKAGDAPDNTPMSLDFGVT